MLPTQRARPGPSRTSPRTSSALPHGNLSAGDSVTSSRRQSASSSLTTSVCGTRSVGQCSTAERTSTRQNRAQAVSGRAELTCLIACSATSIRQRGCSSDGKTKPAPTFGIPTPSGPPRWCRRSCRGAYCAASSGRGGSCAPAPMGAVASASTQGLQDRAEQGAHQLTAFSGAQRLAQLEQGRMV